MNKERMLQLADYIEKLPEHKFEMQYWISQKVKKENYLGEEYWKIDYAPTLYTDLSKSFLEPLDCGTACCIAGWAAAIESNFKPIAIIQDGKSIEERAAAWLDLNYEEERNLFMLSIDTVWTYYIEKCSFDLNEDEDGFTGITNKDAALVIRDVANGVVDIDKNFDFFTAKEYLTDLGYYNWEDEDSE
jgi:hypothetical protein